MCAKQAEFFEQRIHEYKKIRVTCSNYYKVVKFILRCQAVICLILFCYFLYTKGNTTKERTLIDQNVSRQETPIRDENRVQQHVGDAEFKKLLNESQDPKAAMHPVLERCPMYGEFRGLNFLHPALRNRLCRNAEAYKLYTDGYPMCNLQNPFDHSMLDIVRQGSDIFPLLDMQNRKMKMFVYNESDYISNTIRRSGTWEPELVHWTLEFALKLPKVTFLDIGSNIGVYSIQAAKLGLPVVSLDANIRNLLRLRLSLDASSLDADLVWNFITTDWNLKYLNFPDTCNVGGATRFEQNLQDTIPVMPLRSGRLTELIRTKTVVIKMDIEGGEADFLRTSGRLFADFNVAAVQMEWSATWLRNCDSSYVLGFFAALGYKVWQVPEFRALDTNEVSAWGQEIDVMWIRHDFTHFVQI